MPDTTTWWREEFGESFFLGFTNALGDPARFPARSYGTLIAAFHAVRVADMRLCGLRDSAEHLAALTEGALATAKAAAPSDPSSGWSAATSELAFALLHGDHDADIVERLISLGDELRMAGHLGPASDVCLTIGRSHSIGGEQLRWLGKATSMAIGAGLFTRADSLFQRLRSVAASGDPGVKPHIDLADAQLQFTLGQYAEAERLARAVAEHPDAKPDADTSSRAMYLLGAALGSQGRHAEAAVAFYDTYKDSPSVEIERWGLVGLAQAFLQEGRVESAYDACILLLAGPLTYTQRVGTLLTVLDTAAYNRDVALLSRVGPEVESLIADDVTQPDAKAKLSLCLGQAQARLGHDEEARLALQRGLAIARKYEVSGVALELTDELSKLAAGSTPRGVGIETGRVGSPSRSPIAGHVLDSIELILRRDRRQLDDPPSTR